MQNKKQIINEALTVARLYWGYSQAELAEKLGVSQAMVSEIERGNKAVTMEMLERYSNALDVRKSQLLFFAEEIEGVEPVRRGRFVVAERVLRLLKTLKPHEDSCEQPS